MAAITQRVFVLTFLLVSSLNMVHVGIQPDDCHCGGACTYYNHLEYEGQTTNHPYHRQCPRDTCSSCDIERGATYTATDTSSRSSIMQTYNIECAINTCVAESSERSNRIVLLAYSETMGNRPPPRVYLQNQSFLYP